MARLTGALLFACLLLTCRAQDRSSLAEILSFEAPHTGSAPAGWSANPSGGIALDDQIKHSGQYACRIQRTADSPNDFSGILRTVPMDVGGKTVELRGFIRTQEVSKFVALWIREDNDTGVLAFESLEKRMIHGTNDWTEYSVQLPIKPEAKDLFFGFLLDGTGKAWVDDIQLLVDGKAFWDAPKAERPKTALDTDHEFDNGSKIVVADLSPVQIANLAELGKVWGFLKYHHPLVAAGSRHWDYDLFRVAPAVLAAPDRTAANAAMAKWIADLGPVAKCEPCAALSQTELHIAPDIDWIHSEERLGHDLSAALGNVYRNRPATGQFFVSQARGIGNPVFDREPAYQRFPYPDAGYRMLALFRIWNIIEYWFPYRDVLHEDWNQVLVDFIPRITLAKSSADYRREMLAFFAHIHDTHANLWGTLQERPPVGACAIPVNVRFIGDRPVVSGYADPVTGAATGLKPGDVVEALDGAAISDLVRQWKPYYAASNDAAILRDMARQFTHGECGDATLRIRRGSETREVEAKRVTAAPPNAAGPATHDLPGPTFRLLSSDVAYLKLSSVKVEDAAKYIDSATGTKGLVIDIRNYPSEFVVFALGSLLVDRETPFARFTHSDLANPGAFYFGPPVSLTPGKVHYNGKIVILVDEVSQSQAEYTTMAFRSSPHASVIGSTTAGADGNVSPIPMPGGLHPMMSGIGVFYPDKRPTQRIGIVPDQPLTPTVEGIAQGRDEVLEAAIRQILGPGAPQSEIEKLAKPTAN